MGAGRDAVGDVALVGRAVSAPGIALPVVGEWVDRAGAVQVCPVMSARCHEEGGGRRTGQGAVGPASLLGFATTEAPGGQEQNKGRDGDARDDAARDQTRAGPARVGFALGGLGRGGCGQIGRVGRRRHGSGERWTDGRQADGAGRSSGGERGRQLAERAVAQVSH